MVVLVVVIVVVLVGVVEVVKASVFLNLPLHLWFPKRFGKAFVWFETPASCSKLCRSDITPSFDIAVEPFIITFCCAVKLPGNEYYLLYSRTLASCNLLQIEWKQRRVSPCI